MRPDAGGGGGALGLAQGPHQGVHRGGCSEGVDARREQIAEHPSIQGGPLFFLGKEEILFEDYTI